MIEDTWAWPTTETMTKTWIATVQEDPDDPEARVLVFPEEMMKDLGWKPGDTIEWDVKDDGTAVLTKKA